MNRKGFSLLELLAVIVLLSVIAIIAVPQILHIIDTSKESANRSSIDGIYSAVQLYYSDTMNYSGISRFSYNDSMLACTENCGVETNLTITGSMGSDSIGWGYADRNNTKVAVYKNNKCYYKINGEATQTKEMSQDECQNIANS